MGYWLANVPSIGFAPAITMLHGNMKRSNNMLNPHALVVTYMRKKK